ncbi:hypothetical protein JXL19_11315 [bacterium]|nr:hypothetical protein [bacterium]
MIIEILNEKKYVIFSLIIMLFMLFIFSSSAWARLRPLKVIEDNMAICPNILIILDTSGSMQLDPNGAALSACDSEGRVYGAHENSRLNIAKSVITDVLNENRYLANFGLMTFKQTHFGISSLNQGYFPYFKGESGTPEPKTKYFSLQELSQNFYTINETPNQAANSGPPCYAPASSFVYKGIEYRLRSSNNSRYHREKGGGDKNTNHNYCFPCGNLCEFPDPDTGKSFTWTYMGSYYEYSKMPISNFLYYFKKYYGPQFTADGSEDENGNASGNVDPNDIFVYYPGHLEENFSYSLAATWNSNVYPVGAPEDDSPDRGGILIVPFSFSTEPSVKDSKANEILQWMGPQNSGGLIATGYTPTGSTLKNLNPDPNYYDDAYSYFANEVIPGDPLVNCRNNYILFVTDGEPTPSSEGTAAVTAAASLYNDQNITVYVVGFGSDTKGSAILDSIAQAGGSPLKKDGHYAFYAGDREKLKDSIKAIIYEAAAGDYASSAPAAGSSSSASASSNIGLLATAEFPGWLGHLKAKNMITNVELWDAGEQLDANHVAYNARNIYTSDLSTGAIVPFFVFGSPNASTLHSLGLGASLEEAAAIIEFISGRDRFWRLYDITNCTPIVVGPPYTPDHPTSSTGHDVFEASYASRKAVVYSGGNDCMLHCFDMADGHEVFAYVPPDLLPKLVQLYLNNGQPSSPEDHIYGVAASPKVYDICIDGTWKTTLVCGEGPGGRNYFALDVTHPSPGDAGYSPSAPFSVLWHTADSLHNTSYDPILGESWSTPALGKINVSGATKYIAFFGSGYDDPSSADAEGLTFIASKFDSGDEDGKIIFTKNVGSASTIVDHALVADAVCCETNGFTTDAYTVDTAGRIWRADISGDPSAWQMNVIYDAGTNQPFFYSPAVLQIGTGTSSCTMLVAGSGTYDDPDINQQGSTFVSKIYLVSLNSSKSVTESVVIPVTDIPMDQGNFPARARITTSPIIIKNNTTSQYEALFLVYVPLQTIGCDFGKTYLIVYKLGEFGKCGFDQRDHIKTIEAGTGKVTGISIAGSSSVLVGISGYGTGSLSTLTALPSSPSSLPSQIKQLYWKEVF